MSESPATNNPNDNSIRINGTSIEITSKPTPTNAALDNSANKPKSIEADRKSGADTIVPKSPTTKPLDPVGNTSVGAIPDSSTANVVKTSPRNTRNKRSRSRSVSFAGASAVDGGYIEDKLGSDSINDQRKRRRRSKSNSRNMRSHADYKLKNLARVYVGNIEKGWDTADNLRRLFSKYGKIVEVPKILRKSNTSYAFIQFSTPEEAKIAIRSAIASKISLGKNTLDIQSASTDRKEEQDSYKPTYQDRRYPPRAGKSISSAGSRGPSSTGNSERDQLIGEMQRYFQRKRIPPCILLLLSHNNSKYCEFVRSEIETKCFFPCEIRVPNNLRMGDVLKKYQKEGINYVCIIGKDGEKKRSVNYRDFSSISQRRHIEKPLVEIIELMSKHAKDINMQRQMEQGGYDLGNNMKNGARGDRGREGYDPNYRSGNRRELEVLQPLGTMPRTLPANQGGMNMQTISVANITNTNNAIAQQELALKQQQLQQLELELKQKQLQIRQQEIEQQMQRQQNSAHANNQGYGQHMQQSMPTASYYAPDPYSAGLNSNNPTAHYDPNGLPPGYSYDSNAVPQYNQQPAYDPMQNTQNMPQGVDPVALSQLIQGYNDTNSQYTNVGQQLQYDQFHQQQHMPANANEVTFGQQQQVAIDPNATYNPQRPRYA